MTNWTLSDMTRRMDIRVGVEYGTDPERVLEILHEVASGHERVRKNPAPSAFFLEFGDSSLNFRVLAWVHVDYRLETESELKVELNKRLKQAGIGIPFPQVDLWVKDRGEDKAAPKPTAASQSKAASETKATKGSTSKSAAAKKTTSTRKTGSATKGKTARGGLARGDSPDGDD